MPVPPTVTFSDAPRCSTVTFPGPSSYRQTLLSNLFYLFLQRIPSPYPLSPPQTPLFPSTRIDHSLPPLITPLPFVSLDPPFSWSFWIPHCPSLRKHAFCFQEECNKGLAI